MMTLIKLPEKAGFALRHAPHEQQRAFLKVIEHCPSNVGQSTQAYSARLRDKIKQIVVVWGGIWLNPEEGNQKLKLQCAQGHLINSRPFYLRQGVWCSECYIESKRYSIATMQAWAAKRQGFCLSTGYINSYSQLTWQCEQGHTWEASADSVKIGRWCSQCLRLQQQAQYLAEIQTMAKARAGECLSNKYINTKSKLKFRCAHGHEWETSAHITRNAQGSWCPVCQIEAMRGSLADLQLIAAERGGQCLATVYTTANDKVGWLCARGHVWYTTPAHVKTAVGALSVFTYPSVEVIKREKNIYPQRNNDRIFFTHYLNRQYQTTLLLPEYSNYLMFYLFFTGGYC